MTEAKFKTTREGDEIVIRINVKAIAAALSTTDNDLYHPIAILDGDAFLDEIVEQMNASNAVEALLCGEIEVMIEDNSDTVCQMSKPTVPAPDPTRHPRHLIENERDIAIAQIRANGIDLPNPNSRH